MTDSTDIYSSDSLLITLSCFAKLHIKIQSLVATLTALLYMKNRFITDYADIQDNMKNSFIAMALMLLNWFFLLR